MTVVSIAVLVAAAVYVALAATGRIKRDDWPSRKARLLLVALGLVVLFTADAVLDSEIAGMAAALVAVAIGIEVINKRSASS